MLQIAITVHPIIRLFTITPSGNDVIGIAGDFDFPVQPAMLKSPESRDYLNAYLCHGVSMLRIVTSIAFLFVFLAATPIAFSAEADAQKCEKSAQCETGQCEKSQCEKGQCAASACTGEKCASFTATSDGCANKTCSGGTCQGKTCQSTTARLIQVTTTVDSGTEAVPPCSGNKQCCAADELIGSETCCSGNRTCCAVDDLVGSDDPCKGGTGCPAQLTAAASTFPECQCGDGCGCCADAEQKYRHQIVALHGKLMEEGTKSAVLAAQLKHSEALAKAHVEFAKQMLKKEVENVHLHAELELTKLRNEASQEIAGTAFEFERVKGSLELARKHNDHLKLELAQRDSAHTEAVTAFKAANVGLAARVADLENRLESINVRLATKPTANQVK